ncbi:MAG: hemerythrin domain-containing protein [Betaproteobacteria bacterium]
MTTPTGHWHAEHVNFARLLNVLEQQLQAFHQDEHPDYALMLDICDYLQNFPDVYHHPREDVAFSRLVLHEAKFKAQVDRLTHEHSIIAWVGKQFKTLLEGCVADSLVGRAEVEACASMYLVYYRHHLNEEERDILPAAAKLLTPEDWAAVAAAVPTGRDPLFGDDRIERFRALRRCIENAVHAPRR